jgi:hypothetical protein
MQVRNILSIAVLGTVLAACGAGTTPDTAKMRVSLVDAPSSGYLEVNVDVQTVQIAGSDGWVVLGTPNRVVNLLALTGGVAETLVDGVTLPAGRYGQMRLVLGPNNTVKLLDGSVHPLKVPSGQQSGVKLTVNFDVKAGTTADVFIDFDAHKSVFVHEAGASGKYIMRPTVRAFDRMVTGSISGTLTVAGSLAPLPNAVVTAQTVGATGPSVARSTTTDAAGHYVLDLLPRDFTYYVVSQPVLYDLTAAPTASYAPKASGPLAISATAPTATFDAAFSLAAATGAVTGAITPAAVLPQVDIVQARLPLPAGSSTQTLIVRTVPATVTASGESYALQVLPVALPDTTYSLLVERQSLDVSGSDVVQLGGVTDAVVTPGATAIANLTAP